MVSTPELDSRGPRSFFERMEYIFTVQFRYCELSVKNLWGCDRMPNFVNFVVWSPLLVGGLVVVLWSRRSYFGLTEIASFVFYSRMVDEEWVKRFISLFLMWIKGMWRWSEFKIFYVTPGMERFSLPLPRTVIFF